MTSDAARLPRRHAISGSMIRPERMLNDDSGREQQHHRRARIRIAETRNSATANVEPVALQRTGADEQSRAR